MDYLLKSSICMTAFYGLYFFGFRRLSFHALNRFYLLASLALSLTIPMLSYEREEVVVVEPSLASETIYSEEIPTQSFDNQVVERTSQVIEPQPIVVDWMQVLSIIYLFGMAVMLFIFLKNIIAIVRVLISNTHQNEQIFYTQSQFSNSSFFNYIFINPENLNPHEQALIIAHESFHAKQLHTLDLLLLGILKAIFWFNPIVYFYQKSLKQIHEYEVDALMSATHDNRDYAHLLLKLGVGTNSLIINQFSTKPLSDRIKFLFTKPTQNMKKLLYFLSIPIIGIGVMAFAQEKVKMVYKEKIMAHKNSGEYIEVQTIIPEIDVIKGEKMGLDTSRQNIISQIDSSKFSYQFSFSDFKLSKADIDSFKVSVDNQLLIEGKDFIVKANKIFLDPKYKGSKTHLHIYSSTGSSGKLLYPQLAKLDEVYLPKLTSSSKAPVFLASNINKLVPQIIKSPSSFSQIAKNRDTLRTILETNKLGKNPLVIINSIEYPSSILYRINPSITRGSTIYQQSSPAGIKKYGERAMDGVVILNTIANKELVLENEKQHRIAIDNIKKQLDAPKKRIQKVILKDLDGKEYEKVSVMRQDLTSVHFSVDIPVGGKVSFAVDGKVVSEDDIENAKQLYTGGGCGETPGGKYDAYINLYTK
jgi:beta-lactamase regulating signal transducer with metallopeptidase domain